MYLGIRFHQLIGLFFLTFTSIKSFSADPVISNEPPTTATIGQTYTWQVDAQDPEGTSLTYSLAPPLVDGMTVNSSGQVSWLPTDPAVAGFVDYALRVIDADNEQVQRYVRLAVTDPNNQLPQSNVEPELEAFVDTPYSYDPQFTDADNDPITYDLATFPTNSNIIISAQGVISWTPPRTDTGAQVIRIKADDGRLGITEKQFKVEVVDPNNTSPVFDSAPVTTGVVGILYQYSIQVSDAQADAVTLVAEVKPSSMNLDTDNNTLSWTPTAPGIYKVMLAAKDDFGGETKQTFNITVTENATGNVAPTANSASVTTIEDESVNIVLEATDPENAPLTYTIGSPSNGSLSGDAPNIIYTPASGFNGPDSFTFFVNDGQLDSNTATVSITVNSVNDIPVADPQTLSVNEDESLCHYA